jgi:hypothetical protein
VSMAEDIIDWAEIYVLEVQPLTPWQRRVIEHMFPEDD